MHQFVKILLEKVISIWGSIERFSFPAKYTWRWKLEMLANRYELETTKLFKKIVKKGNVVVDIGAHIGYFSRLAARLVGPRGSVYAFEPDEQNRTLLAGNTGHFINVTIQTEAVTDRNGTTSFYHVPGSTGCHSTVPQRGGVEYSVSTTTLDAFIDKNKINRLDVVKIDVEGGELGVLRGMTRALQGVSHLIVECNPEALSRASHSSDELVSELRKYGFSISLLRGKEETPLHDAAEVHKYLADGSVNLHCQKP